MNSIEQIKAHFPNHLQNQKNNDKHILKEYIQLLILDYLSSTSYISNLVFIGGTNLRLVKGINRFSEDLDFDCKAFSNDDFMKMTDSVSQFLERSGYKVEIRDKKNLKLNAFRRSIYFPDLLFNLDLSAFREERFLLKIEAQDQEIAYSTKTQIIKGCGFFFPMPVPPDDILCAMKISALLSRAKGRDFYDTLFLLAQTQPNYDFLEKRTGVKNSNELLVAIDNLLENIDINQKLKDFEHLLFRNEDAKKLLMFRELVRELIQT